MALHFTITLAQDVAGQITLPAEVEAITGPLLDAPTMRAISEDFDTIYYNFKEIPLNATYGNKIGWSTRNYEQWVTDGRGSSSGSPGDSLFSAGASYNAARLHYLHHYQELSSDPAWAATMLARANDIAETYYEGFYTNNVDNPGSAHWISDDVALYGVINDLDAVKASFRYPADGLTNTANYNVLQSNTDTGNSGRLQARYTLGMIYAWMFGAASGIGGYTNYAGVGGRATELLSPLLDGIMDTFGYVPNATQTTNDTPARSTHDGPLRHSLHDYYDKPFMTALVLEMLWLAHRNCESILDPAVYARIVPAMCAALNYQNMIWDQINECVTYPEGPNPTEGGVSAAPDNNNFWPLIAYYAYHQTGNTQYRDQGDRIIAGSLHSAAYSPLSVPEYLAQNLRKQFCEHHYTIPMCGYWRQASPLATPSVPVNSAAPAITGTASVGQTLTCSTGTWNNSPSGYSYQWFTFRDCSAYTVSDGAFSYDQDAETAAYVGSNQNTYVLQAGDADKVIRCCVIANNGSGSSVPYVTNETTAIA